MVSLNMILSRHDSVEFGCGGPPGTAIAQIARRLSRFWTVVAERSGDTAFRPRTKLPKRCALNAFRIPATVQKGSVAALPRWVFYVSAAYLALLLSGCEKSSPSSQNDPKTDSASKVSSASPVEVTSRSGVEMVYLPGGEFLMGSAKGNADEAPVHKVRVTAFLMDKFEV